jgi:hypothetical protein
MQTERRLIPSQMVNHGDDRSFANSPFGRDLYKGRNSATCSPAIQFASIGRNASHRDGVGRGFGVGRGLGVTLGVAVGVAVGVGVTVGVGVRPPCAQYLPPLLK